MSFFGGLLVVAVVLSFVETGVVFGAVVAGTVVFCLGVTAFVAFVFPEFDAGALREPAEVDFGFGDADAFSEHFEALFCFGVIGFVAVLGLIATVGEAAVFDLVTGDLAFSVSVVEVTGDVIVLLLILGEARGFGFDTGEVVVSLTVSTFIEVNVCDRVTGDGTVFTVISFSVGCVVATVCLDGVWNLSFSSLVPVDFDGVLTTFALKKPVSSV